MLGVTQGNLFITFLMKHQGWKNTILIFAGLGIILSAIMAMIIPKQKATAVSENLSPLSGMKNLSKEMLKLAKNPTVWANGIVGCLLFLSLSAFAEAWGVSYFEQGRGYSKEIAVHLNNCVFWGWAIGSPVMGWLSEKLKNRRLLMVGGALGTALTFATLLYLPSGTPLEIIKALLFLIGACSSVEILVFPIARELSSSGLAASALAFTNLLVMIGGVILQPGIGYLLQFKWDGHTINNIPVYSLAAYQFSLLAIALGGLLAAVIAFLMRETYQSDNCSR
jgi:sugar phosphate permease